MTDFSKPLPPGYDAVSGDIPEERRQSSEYMNAKANLSHFVV